jgi:chromosomal replication initiator protein
VRRLDLLALDDIHFLSNKSATQQELLHTLDAIDLSGARIVMASDEHPRHVNRFSQALVSRCVKGIVVEVQRPDRATRLSLIRHVAAARGLRLHDAAVEVIATHCVGSVREIEGALAKLAAMRLLSPSSGGGADGDGAPIGVVLVERMFRDDRHPRTPVRLASIVEAVCAQLGVDRAEVMSASRHRRIVLARGLISHLARELTTHSFPEIARALGRRNHSTILTAGRRLQEQLEAEPRGAARAGGDPCLRELIDQLRHLILRTAHAA